MEAKTANEKTRNGNLSSEKLKEALDKSSSINRAIGFTFGIFIFYIAITVAATTDKDLFFPDSGFSVPFLNLKLGTVNFFLAAPFVVLIVHYNFLYNLMQHSKKLLRWHSSNKKNADDPEIIDDARSDEDLDMYPFLFNFALNVKNPIHNRTLNIVNRITIFMLPLALLCFILFRFADYQSMLITFWHFAAVLLDAALIATHSFSILKIIKTHNEALKEEYRFMEFFNFLKQGRGFKKQWKNAGKLIVTAFPVFFATLISSVVALIAGIWNLLTTLKFCKTSVFKSAISCQVLLYKYLRIETLMVHLATLFAAFFVYIMVVDFDFKKEEELPYQEGGYSKMDSTIFKIKSFPYKFQKSILPNLNLREEILVKSQPEEEIIQLHLSKDYSVEDREKVKQEIILEYSKGYILKGRSFRYADFYKTIVTKTDFREADLTEANFSDANIQKANLHDAILSKAHLFLSNLQGADLLDADFQGADLTGVNLLGAVLLDANFQGADLSDANLKGAEVLCAYLQGADLRYANLQAADLSLSEFHGALLEKASLLGADLWQAKLQGACLLDADFQGADLSDANLQGAILNKTKLRGSLFSEFFSDALLLINETDEIDNSFFDKNFERNLDSIAAQFPDNYTKTEFRNQMIAGKERYDKDSVNTILAQRIPNAKIYCPKDLETDNAFFVIRRRIASISKETARGMLKSTNSNWEKIPVYKALYTDLYNYLNTHHTDYLEGFEYEEDGKEVSK